MSTFKDLQSSSDQPFNRLVAVVLSICLGVAVFWAGDYFELKRLIDGLEMKTYDIRAFIHNGQHGNLPPNQPSDDILIVKFDDPTLNNYEDEYGTWPWRRSVHADMIQWMNEAGAKVIAYDIMFVSKIKGQEEADLELIKAFEANDNVYLSMNFDNNLGILRQLGKQLRPDDYKLIQPLSLGFESQMKPRKGLLNFGSTHFEVDNRGEFFTNESMTFNNYRRIMPELIENQERIAFVNHGRDKDGVSRSNPLIFRLVWADPDVSEVLPYHFVDDTEEWTDVNGNKQQGKWLDAAGTWVDASGCRMVQVPNTKKWRCKEDFKTDFYPYLGMRLAMDLLMTEEEREKAILTDSGQLEFPGSDISIPLNRDGALLIKWYNINVDKIKIEASLKQLWEYRNGLTEDQTEEMQKADELISTLTRQLHHFKEDFQAKPYQEVSAWRILKAIKDEADGNIKDDDLKLKKNFKDKIIFVGTTAVSTYDIKTTPINKIMPGVVLQATIFDNIYQNTTYMRRLGDFENNILTGFICIISALLIIKLRSALAGMGMVMTLAGLYTLVAVLLYQHMSLWINIAAPLVFITVITTLTYMVKYISRNRDYEQTYVMATTDAMTGLKNHRFFQEHLRESMQYADRFNGKFSLLLVDIDHFKKFNDTYGHQAGDEVLRAVARKLQNSVRSNDLVARYGGEEMAVVLDKANEQEALEVAKKIVRTIAEEAYPIAEGVSKHVTISCGVATYPTHGKTPTELIEFSDQGLYRAKEAGRNRVGAQFDEDMPEGWIEEETTPEEGGEDEPASA